jgi:F-type H+-transporting ATPase subunit a
VDFGNKNLSVLFTWGDKTVYLTETIFATWIVMGILFIFTIFVNIRLRKFRGVPRGFQNVIEALIDMMRKFATETLGEELEQLNGYFFGAFTFILVSNYSGMFGLRPPTSDWSTTLALAAGTFIAIQLMGAKHRKMKYLKSFFRPFFLFFPLNVIGELSKPISMSFRLFGNILSGLILMALVYTVPLYIRFVIPVVLHLYFDILIGALQTYIFCMLSLTFINGAVNVEE